MKPEFRSSANCLPHAAFVPAGSGTTEVTLPAQHTGLLHALVERVAGWWRDREQRREEWMRIESLTPLSSHMLEDIGVSDELRSRTIAQRESHFERFARTTSEVRGMAERFGPW
jgi:uncharacterized protein YjiS (DUF1127 family)